MNKQKISLKVDRAISELRRGGQIVVSDFKTGVSVLLMAAEMVDLESIDNISQNTSSNPNLILSPNRATELKLNTNNSPCSIIIDREWSIDDILSLCMPLYKHPIPKLNGVIFENLNSITSICILLLRQARLLPAGIMSIISNINIEKTCEWATNRNYIYVEDSHVNSFEPHNSKNLTIAVRAKVPLEATSNSEIVVFRPKDGGNEHFCLLIGKSRNIKNNKDHSHNPLVRIHSQCITGDVLDSLKCDCGQQLKDSIRLMAKADEGILIYLAQEGRDIGLLNKLRAYTLQEDGMDTVEANLALGFNDDERLYYPAKEILDLLDVKSIKLITNNPNKINHMSNLGIKITKRVPIKIKPNKHNKIYLQTKSNKSGHIL